MEVKEFFEQNKDRNQVFQTSDGSLFFEKCDARNHAGDLEDKQVKIFFRESLHAESKPNPEDVDVIKDDNDPEGQSEKTLEPKEEDSEPEVPSEKKDDNPQPLADKPKTSTKKAKE